MNRSGASRSGRLTGAVVGAIALASVLSHLPSMLSRHVEGDEVIFAFLAQRLAQSPLEYHLRGELQGQAAHRFVGDTWLPIYTHGVPERERRRIAHELAGIDRAEVLRTPFGAEAYDPQIYARPIFLHPPLYPYSLAIARALAGRSGAALLSAALHAITIVLVGVLGTTWGGPALGVLGALLTAIEPVSWLCGNRLWIDAMLAALVTGAVLAVVRAVDAPSNLRCFAAGLVLGLACLAKLSAVLVVPGVVAAALLARRPLALRHGIWYVTGAALCVVPWLALTRFANGQWLPDPYPTAWQIAHYPYVAQAVARPAHFYLTGLLLVAPLFAYVPVALWRRRGKAWLRVPAAWVLGFVVPLSALGIAGLGFQLRYMAPATPALCVMTAAGILSLGRWSWLPATALMAATVGSSTVSATDPAMAEPVPYVIERGLAAVGADSHFLEPLWRRTR